MQRLAVLLTNFELDVRGGTQLYLRDLAVALLARGHRPLAYAPRLGDVAREMEQAGVPVTDNLTTIGQSPDIIHAHHNHELFTAVLRFPGVPAVRVCHGWLDERPQPFPRVRRYIAVDDTTRDRCVCEWGVPVDRVQVLLNFVDLARFTPRAPLPPRPRRALVFSHNAREHAWAVRAACDELGIAVETMGRTEGTESASPERQLQQYDVVFAKARAALEALACGAAVVLCDRAGVGPMVTSAEFPRLRRLNFGIRTLTRVLSPAAIASELARYDPADASAVSAKVRATAGADRAIETLLACYRDVLDEQGRATADRDEEFRAASAYLRALSPRVAWAETPAASRQLLLRSLHRSTSMVPGVRRLLGSSWSRRMVLSARDWRRRLDGES